MEDTRASLTDKLETLEAEVVGTVQQATSAVTETVEAIKDSVKDTVASVTDTVSGTVDTVKETVEGGVETVKGWFDVGAHTERHPWLVVGGSALAGWCLQGLLTRLTRVPAAAPAPEPTPAPARAHHGNGGGHQKRHDERGATLFGANLRQEFRKLKGLALGALLGTAREMILKAVPEQLAAQVGEVVDSLTEKFGGEPVPRAGEEEHTGAFHEDEREGLGKQQQPGLLTG